MKLVKIRYTPLAEIEFTVAEVRRLMVLSSMHYDGECKKMGRVGGLIYGLNNHFCVEEPEATVSRLFTFHELDMLNKVAESTSEFNFSPVLSQLNVAFDKVNP